MTRRREVEHELHMMEEIRGIMGSMKTLAMLETRKLGRYLATQQRVVDSIATAAADFRRFHPLPAPAASAEVVVLVGSERGFCGDFNERLVTTLDEYRAQRPELPVVAVGRKLATRLEHLENVAEMLEGPSVAEEVQPMLTRLVETLEKLSAPYHGLSLTVISHTDETGTISTETVLPPFEHLQAAGPAHTHPPLLNLSPEAFWAELVEHYLFAALHRQFYASLMAENQRRVRHLDGAVRHLSDNVDQLTLKRNSLRQEEVTEEIEVIMLSVDVMDEKKVARNE